MRELLKKATVFVLVFAMLLSLTTFVPAYAVEEPSGGSVTETDGTGQELPNDTETDGTTTPADETPPSVGESNGTDPEDEPSTPAAGASDGEDAAGDPEDENSQPPVGGTGENETEEPEEPDSDGGSVGLMSVDLMSLDEVPEGYIGVYTKDDLYDVRSNPSAKYIQMADIEFTAEDFTEDGDFYNMGQGWNPIGTSSTPFTGTYDGNGHVIRGLQITSTKDYQGLFGYASGATIQNVILEDAAIGGANYVGGVCGYAIGTTVKDCKVSGSVSGSNTVGGIVGGYFNDGRGTAGDRLP